MKQGELTRSGKRMFPGGKRVFAALLALVMAVALLPATAFAVGESGIQLGASGIAVGHSVYYGVHDDGTTEYNVPWIVLGGTILSETSVAPGANVLPLLSKYTIGTSYFRNSGDRGYYGQNAAGDANSGSVLKAAMDGLYDGTGTTLFSNLEQGAIAETALAGNSMHRNVTSAVTAHLFPLSNNEAEALDWGSDILRAPSIDAPGGITGKWWHRTSYNPDNGYAYFVQANGHSGVNFIDDNSIGVRPAFNLNLSSVLFTCAAVDGKLSSAVGAGALNSNLTPSGTTEWKLTLEDTTRRFAAATTAYDSASKIVTVAYYGATPYNATTAPNEYISAIVTDSSDNIKYYGRIAQPTAAAGTLTIDLSGVAMATTDTLQVFSEQYNGDKRTDYASTPVTVALTQSAYTVTNTLTNITSSNAATFRLITDTSNYAATLSASANFAPPTAITVKVGGAELANTAYAYSNGSLSIPAASITGDIEIIAAGVRATTVTATVGSTATFTVTAANATGYQWYIDRGNESGWQTITGANAASYTITAVTMANSGYRYYCRISNASGGEDSPIFTLNVIEYVDVPATGDSAMPGLWIGIMMLAGTGLAASAILAKRKRKA